MTTFGGFGLGAVAGLVTRAFLGCETGSSRSMDVALRFLEAGAVVAASVVVFALRDFAGSLALALEVAVLDFLAVVVVCDVRPLVAAVVVFFVVVVFGFAAALDCAIAAPLGGIIVLNQDAKTVLLRANVRRVCAKYSGVKRCL